MKNVNPKNWQPSEGIILEENADATVHCCDNHILVVAGPGAGKTELLAQKAAFLFQTNLCKNPQKILAISFKTDAAQNLEERVQLRCGDRIKERFVSMTYDAFAKSMLDHFLYALPEALRPNADYVISDFETIDLAFINSGYMNNSNLSKSRLQTYYESELGNVVLPLKNTDIASEAWSLLLKGFDGRKATLTFKMIMKLAEHIIRTNPQIKRALRTTYSYVFLDEFQDSTNLQYGFVKECFLGSNTKITAVGDNKQRIMIWAGARKTIFDDFKREFNSQETQLIMNHRSAPRLVALQQEMYESLQEDRQQVVVSNKWKPNEGTIKLVIADNETKEADVVVEDVLRHISEGVPPKDIAILCKQTPDKYTSIIIQQLQATGVRARVETYYQDLIKDTIVDILLDFMICVCDRKKPEIWERIENFFIDLWGINTINQNNSYEKMQKKLVSLADEVRELLTKNVDEQQWMIVLDKILDVFDINKIKAKFPVYAQGDFFKQQIGHFEELFWKEYKVADGNWTLAIENFRGEHSIPIMTIHKSKGLEYSVVYFVGLEDSAFWNFKNQSEEDRCSFFVALSRAKKDVIFTFCEERLALRNHYQSHDTINEFFDLLKKPNMATIIDVTSR